MASHEILLQEESTSFAGDFYTAAIPRFGINSFFPLIITNTINNQEPKFLIVGLFCFLHRASGHLKDVATTCSRIICNTSCPFNQEDSTISLWGSSKNKSAPCILEGRKTQPCFREEAQPHIHATALPDSMTFPRNTVNC